MWRSGKTRRRCGSFGPRQVRQTVGLFWISGILLPSPSLMGAAVLANGIALNMRKHLTASEWLCGAPNPTATQWNRFGCLGWVGRPPSLACVPSREPLDHGRQSLTQQQD